MSSDMHANVLVSTGENAPKTPGHAQGNAFALPRVTNEGLLEGVKASENGGPSDLSLDRLIVLGEDALRTCFTSAMFVEKPAVGARLIRSRRDELMSVQVLAHWATNDNIASVIDPKSEGAELERLADLFKAYIALIYLQDGLLPERKPTQDNEVSSEPPRKRGRVGEDRPSDLPIESSTFDSKASTAPVPHRPTSNVPSAPGVSGITHEPQDVKSGSTPKGIGCLAYLNQVAALHRKQVTWKMVSVGPPHQLEWHTNVSVDGAIISGGKGNTKQAAKEAAAQRACEALGWKDEGTL